MLAGVYRIYMTSCGDGHCSAACKIITIAPPGLQTPLYYIIYYAYTVSPRYTTRSISRNSYRVRLKKKKNTKAKAITGLHLCTLYILKESEKWLVANILQGGTWTIPTPR